ncbi:MAG: nucleotide exchange factor GrpE [Armatimonadota bacterium]
MNDSDKPVENEFSAAESETAESARQEELNPPPGNEESGAETTTESPSAEEKTAAPSSEEVLQRELEEMRRRLEEQERESRENRDLFLRTMADLENFRRRARQEKEEIRQRANQELLSELLPVLDDFERALDAAQQTRNFDALCEGVSMILRKMQDLLAKHGVEPIEAVGKPFDPALHEAVLQTPASDQYPPGTVVAEIRKGYTLNGKLLRASLVNVAKEEADNPSET